MDGYYTFVKYKGEDPNYKGGFIPRWNCKHMKDATPILLFQHRRIKEIPTREWLNNRYSIPCKIYKG